MQQLAEYKVGDYVDYYWVNWTAKTIIEITPQGTAKLREPRSVHTSTDTVQLNNSKLKPFRTETRMRSYAHSCYNRGRRLNEQLAAKRLQELREFDFSLQGMTAKDVIQFVRGRHFFFLEEIINSQYEGKEQLAPALIYLRAHLTFVLQFLQHADFQQFSSDSYVSPMAGLCSGYAEMLEGTLVALGLGTDAESFRKENAERMELDKVRLEQREWVENELLPSLSQLRGESLPAAVIFTLFNFLLTLLRKGKTEESEPLSVLCNDLYGHLLAAMRTAPPDLKELDNFSKDMDALFTLMHRAHPDALPHQSPSTQRLDEEEEAKGATTDVLTRERFVKRQRLEFKLAACEYYYRIGRLEGFIRELNLAGAEIGRELDQLTPREATDPTRWSPVIAPFLNALLQRNILQHILDPVTPDLINLSRQVMLKLFKAMPREVIQTALERRVFTLFKMIISSNNKTMRDEELAHYLSEQLERLPAQKKDVKENFDLLATFIQWVRNFLGSHETGTLMMQRKVIGKQLELIGLMNQPEHAPTIDSFLSTSDPYKDDLLREYTVNTILPAFPARSSLFNELLLLRYLRAHTVSLELFTHLCQFMLDPQFELNRYEKRKDAVLSVLHRQFDDPATYQDYLGAFLEPYCKEEGHKHLSWSGVSLLPNRDCYREFLAIKFTKEFCRDILLKLQIYNDLDITLFELFLIKYNFLAGNFLMGPDEDVQLVMKVPEFFDKLVSSLIMWSALLSPHKKHRSQSLERIISSFFRAADERCYGEMLVAFLKVLLSSKEHPLEPVRFFTDLRRKTTKLHQLQGEVKVDKLGKLQAVVYNKTVENSLKGTFSLQQHNEFMRELFCEESKNGVYHLSGLAELDTFDVVRHKIASKCNREPQNFIILFNEDGLKDEQLRLPIVPTLQPSYKADEETIPPPLIFHVSENPKRSLLETYLLDNLGQIFSSNVHKSMLINGMQLPAMDWKSYGGLMELSERFLGYLKDNSFPDSLQRDLFCQDVMLDFYIWKVEDYNGLRFDYLLPYLREVSMKDELLRNFKILYLIHRASKLDPSICEDLLLLLLPVDVDDTRRYESDFEVTEELFQMYCHLVFKIIEQTHPNVLQFLFTLKSIKKFQEQPPINGLIKQFWKRVYNETPMPVKEHFFSNIEQRMLRYPECMYHFQFIIGDTLHINEKPFYDNLLYRMTKQLVALNRPSNTISEGQAIKALISNMETLLQIGAQHEVVYSEELLEFLMAKIYECSSSSLQQLLGVLNHTLERDENRKNLLQFLMKQMDEKEWQAKFTLVKPKKKYELLQMQDLVGLKNPHSICYINSFLQQLYNIDLFRVELLGAGWKLNPIPEQDLILQLKKIFVNLHEQREPYINYDFFKAFKNLDGEPTATDVQMDVDEFRNMLFDRIQSLLPKEYNFMPKIFNGKLASVIKSLECEHQSTREEDFSSLCIEVKGFPNLQASLKNYLKPEILQNENAYHCDDCKKKVKAQKYIELRSFPPYLTFVLKRFEYVSYRRLKINSSFEFPLHTFQYFPGVKYKLKGIIVHIGVSEAGHYISFIKRNDIWYEFNDSYVSEVSEQYVLNFSYGNTKEDGYSYMSTKNAYLIIYEADNVPKPQIPDPNRPYFGIENEIKNIKKTKALQDKQKVFFDTQFLKYACSIVKNFPEQQSLRLLFNLILTISFKTMKPDGLKEEDMINALKTLKRLSGEMSFLWQEKQLEKIMQTVQLNLPADFKAIICDLLVSSCANFDAVVENLLEDCLQKLYIEAKDVSFYYGLMHRLALKFDRVCFFLNDRRIVGRILDLTYEGLIGQKIRLDLKKSSPVPFESPLRTRLTKDVLKNDMRYRKWSLLNLVLTKCDMGVHQLEKQYYLYQTNSMYFKSIFDELQNKATINEVSRYFRFLAEKNEEYSNKLISYLSDSLERDKPQELRKYLRVLKELMCIEDQHTHERIRKSTIIFHKLLKKFSQDRVETSCDYVWQWMLKIGKKNRLFRKELRDKRSLFEHVLKFKVLGAKYLSYQDSFKPDKTKNRSYGLVFANVYRDVELIHKQKIDQTRKLLFDEGIIEQQADWDSDEDIVREEITEQNNIFMRYCDETTLIEYLKVRVVLAIGQTIFFRYDRHPEVLQSNERSSERWFRFNDEYIGSQSFSEQSPHEI